MFGPDIRQPPLTCESFIYDLHFTSLFKNASIDSKMLEHA